MPRRGFVGYGQIWRVGTLCFTIGASFLEALLGVARLFATLVAKMNLVPPQGKRFNIFTMMADRLQPQIGHGQASDEQLHLFGEIHIDGNGPGERSHGSKEAVHDVIVKRESAGDVARVGAGEPFSADPRIAPAQCDH